MSNSVSIRRYSLLVRMLVMGVFFIYYGATAVRTYVHVKEDSC